MLTTEEIKKELDAGREVELKCVDVEGFLRASDATYSNKEILSKRTFSVSIPANGNLNSLEWRCSNMIGSIASKYLIYFSIKRPAPTFDDLIDVAVKAVKDNVIFMDSFCVDNIRFEPTSSAVEERAFDVYDGDSEDIIRDAISYIESLYTETFVIESEEDFKKFGSPVESIVLANGEDIINDVMFHRNEPYFTGDCISMVKVGFNILKGATVTQKRGEV